MIHTFHTQYSQPGVIQSSCPSGVWGPEMWGGGVSPGGELLGLLHQPVSPREVQTPASSSCDHVPGLQDETNCPPVCQDAVCLHKLHHHSLRHSGKCIYFIWTTLWTDIKELQKLMSSRDECLEHVKSDLTTIVISWCLRPTFTWERSEQRRQGKTSFHGHRNLPRPHADGHLPWPIQRET